MSDDYAGSTATTGRLTVSGSRSATIETVGDTDWFAITLQAGYTYRFDMLGADSSGGTLPDPFMRVRDSSGNSLAFDDDSGTGLNARISSFVAPYSGTFYVSAGSSTSSGTGTYQLTATQTAALVSTFTLTPVSTTVSEGVGSITFTVTRSQGTGSETVYFSTIQNQGFTNSGDYTGIANQAVTFSAGVTSSTVTVSITNDTTAENTETYGAIIENAAGTTLDSSTFTITDNDTVTPSTFTLTPVSTTVSEGVGSITFTVTRSQGTGSETVYFSTIQNQGFTNSGDYTGIANQAVTFSAGVTSSTVTVSITNDTTAENTETYGAIIESTSATLLDTSTFIITDDDAVSPADDYSGSTSTTGTLAVGGTRSGNIEIAGDTDWFGVTLQAGNAYQFDMLGSPTNDGTLADAFMRIRDSTGNTLALDDDTGTGFNAQISNFVAPSSGTFYISAGSATTSGIGTYRLTATQTGTPSPADDYAGNISTVGTLAVGSSQIGTIEAAGDTDWFRINLQAGYTYQFDMLGSDSGDGSLSDPFARIRDASGNSLAFDDDSGSGMNARVSGFVAPYSGFFYLSSGSAVTADTGTFRLTATQTATPAQPATDDFSANSMTSGQISVTSSTRGQIENASDADWFRINLTAGTIYTFDARGMPSGDGTLADPFLQLLDAQGNILVQNDDGGDGANARIANFTASTSGQYFLSVRSYDVGGTGTYTISGSQVAAPTAPVTGTLVTQNSFIVNLPSNGVITTYFGGHPYITNGSGYYAIDVAGNRYDNVLAGVSGTIVHIASGNEELPLTIDPNGVSAEVLGINQNGGFGNTVTILSDNGLYVSYSHLTNSSIVHWVNALTQGDAAALRVTAGTTIVGQMGQNGSMWSSSGTPWHAHVQMGVGLIYVSGAGRAPYADGRLTTNASVTIRLMDTSGNILNGSNGSLVQAGGGIGGGNLSNVEYSLLGSDLNDTIIVGSSRTAASGEGGDDTFLVSALSSYIFGGSGNDTVDYRGIETSVLVDLSNVNRTSEGWNYHSSVENVLLGRGDDTLIAIAPAQSLSTGEGSDRIVINGLTGNANIDGGAGIDTLAVSGAVSLASLSGIEKLELSGGASLTLTSSQVTNGLAANTAISGSGTITIDMGVSDSELYLQGFELALGSAITFVVNGGQNDDIIKGNPDAINVLDGGSGDDLLYGGSGIDRMYGGQGNDTFLVSELGDLVFESANQGIDTVIASTGFYLYQNIENLTLDAGAGSIYGVGNELANVLTGNGGANLLLGRAGDDTFEGAAGNDQLFGEDGNDLVMGGAGIDYLVGGTGNDSLYGGADADALYGEDGDDYLDGGTSFDTDILVGGAGNDTLFAVSGQANPDYDLIDGGAGDDTYWVDTGADLTFEAIGGGIDTVHADVTVPNAGVYLYANVENLILEGTTAFGVGNELDNALTGSASSNWLLGGEGNDTINGMGGNDVLYGEAGNDTFVFGPGNGGDVIGDFTSGQDHIQLNGQYANFAELQTHFIQNGNVGAIDLGGGNLIVLHNVTMSNLTAADFIFAAVAEPAPKSGPPVMETLGDWGGGARAALFADAIQFGSDELHWQRPQAEAFI